MTFEQLLIFALISLAISFILPNNDNKPKK